LILRIFVEGINEAPPEKSTLLSADFSCGEDHGKKYVKICENMPIDGN
jgi:hypothetical protein